MTQEGRGICILRDSTHYCAIAPRSRLTLQGLLSFIALCACQVLQIVDFLGSCRIETAPTSIEVLLRPTQSQSDEPSDLRGSLSPTTRHRCTMS